MHQYVNHVYSNQNHDLYQNTVTYDGIVHHTFSLQEIQPPTYARKSLSNLNNITDTKEVRISRTSRPSSVIRRDERHSHASIDRHKRDSVNGFGRDLIHEQIMADEIQSNSFEPSIMEDRDMIIDTPSPIEPRHIRASYGGRESNSNFNNQIVYNQHVADNNTAPILRSKTHTYAEDSPFTKNKNENQLIINKSEFENQLDFNLNKQSCSYASPVPTFRKNSSNADLTNNFQNIGFDGTSSTIQRVSNQSINNTPESVLKHVTHISTLDIIPEQYISSIHNKDLFEKQNNDSSTFNCNQRFSVPSTDLSDTQFNSANSNIYGNNNQIDQPSDKRLSKRPGYANISRSQILLTNSNVSDENESSNAKAPPKKSAMKKNKSQGLKRVTIAEHNNEQIEVSKWLQNIDSTNVSPCIKTPTFVQHSFNFNSDIDNGSRISSYRYVNSSVNVNYPTNYTRTLKYSQNGRTQTIMNYRVADFSAPGSRNTYPL